MPSERIWSYQINLILLFSQLQRYALMRCANFSSVTQTFRCAEFVGIAVPCCPLIGIGNVGSGEGSEEINHGGSFKDNKRAPTWWQLYGEACSLCDATVPVLHLLQVPESILWRKA